MIATTPKVLLGLLVATVFSISLNAWSEESVVKVFKIESKNGEDVSVEVKHDKDVRVFKLDMDEVTDESYLDEQLADLPVDLRENLIAELATVSGHAGALVLANDLTNSMRKVFVVSGDDAAKHVVIDTDGYSFSNEFVTEEGMTEFVASGKKRAIVSLLEKGDFTPEQLDEIQAALDRKR